MANFIRLKQIESGSALTTAASTGTDFSASVNAIVSQSLETSLSQSIVNIIVNNVQAALPDGIISSSAQINLSQASGSISSSQIVGEILANAIDYADVTNKPTLVSGSAQVIGILDSLNQFTGSLNDTYATDAELTTTSSLIVDQGEW
jgi:hypothetical protein